MAVLATTATLEDIVVYLKDATTVLRDTEIKDLDRSFQENGKTFHVFALHPGMYQKKIEKAIIESGHNLEWL